MTPTEAEEQIALVQYLRLKNLAHFRVPNETFTKSWRQKNMNTALGVSKGVPDLFVIVAGKLIAIEMKRAKNSATSPEQKAWIARLNDVGVPARVCKGFIEAKMFIEELSNAGNTRRR